MGISMQITDSNVSKITLEVTQTVKEEIVKSCEAIYNSKEFARLSAFAKGWMIGRDVGQSIAEKTFYLDLFLKVTSPFTQYYVHKLITDYNKPSLTKKTNKLSWRAKWTQIFTEFFFGKTPKEKKDPPIFDKELTKKMEDILAVAQNAKENDGYLENILLYGPPGTGKTMFAEMVATNSGMDYIEISGGELSQFIKDKEHVGALNRLLQEAKTSPNQTVLFIDEAESLCKKRKDLSQPYVELLNAFLAQTGTQDKKMMLILATNRIEDLDEAALSRMTHKIKVKRPGVEERAKIITKYVLDYFPNNEEREALFSEKKISEIAKQTDGFTGRSLFQLVNALNGRKGVAQEKQLTEKMVTELVQEFVKQEKELLKSLKTS